MGTLRYAILGLLNRNNMTGYEMSKAFEQTLSAFWTAKHSQIYPELKNLTRDGLVKYHVAITGNVLEKKVYSITDSGREEFNRWEQTLTEIPPFPKDEFRLQLYFSSDQPPQFQLSLLSDQLAQHEKRLLQIQKDLDKFSSIPPENPADFSDYLLIRGGILREEATCNWLRECIALCKKRQV